MRRLTAVVAGVLAAVLLPFALLSSWVAGVVTDTDRYVSTVRPLASDPEVKKAVIALLERRATAQVRELTGGLGLGDDALRVVVRSAATAVVESPAFEPAWAAANRSAHRQLVRVLESDDSAVLDSRGRVSVELGTVLNTVIGDLRSQGLLPAGTPDVQASFALVRADDLSDARRAYEILDALGFWLPVLWLACVITVLLFAGSRLAAVRRLGAAAMVATILVLLLLGATRDRILSGSPDDEVVGALWDVLTRDLERVTWTVFAAGLLAALAGAVPAILRKARSDD